MVAVVVVVVCCCWFTSHSPLVRHSKIATSTSWTGTQNDGWMATEDWDLNDYDGKWTDGTFDDRVRTTR